MAKRPGRGSGSRRNRRGQGGGGNAPQQGGRGSGGKRGRGGRSQRPKKSDYFMQPGKGGVFIVLRRPIGNRAHAKVCGTMPSRVHAKMLIDSLQRAESVVKDLFMEATDDGIEALEAVLAATREDVMRRGPAVEAPPEDAERDDSEPDDSEPEAMDLEMEADDDAGDAEEDESLEGDEPPAESSDEEPYADDG